MSDPLDERVHAVFEGVIEDLSTGKIHGAQFTVERNREERPHFRGKLPSGEDFGR